MRTSRLRRVVAVVTAAAVLASLTAATVASPASAAKPKCQGQTATIVGTARGELIRGTAGRDVIVAKGGNDRIYGRGGNDLICAGTGNDLVVGGPGADTVWGQLGNDRLNGGPGNDFLAGQVGNDTINGGINYDKCYQGTGTGAVVNCELPVVAPPPPPEPPTLVIAYSDVNTNHVYDAGDIMISKIVDTNGDGSVSPGDTIKMGQYPTSPNVIKPAQLRSQFEDWKVKEHPVTSGDTLADPDFVSVESGPDRQFKWSRIGGISDYDWFEEVDLSADSEVFDHKTAAKEDGVYLETGSPSQPASAIEQSGYDGLGDDGVIDVDLAPGV